MTELRTARPKRGTVLMTALCAGCNRVLYRHPRGDWQHDDGDGYCTGTEDDD